MIRVTPVMLRPATTNNVLPFPLTVHTSQDVMIFLHPKLLQGLLKGNLSIPVFALKSLQAAKSGGDNRRSRRGVSLDRSLRGGALAEITRQLHRR